MPFGSAGPLKLARPGTAGTGGMLHPANLAALLVHAVWRQGPAGAGECCHMMGRLERHEAAAHRSWTHSSAALGRCLVSGMQPLASTAACKHADTSIPMVFGFVKICLDWCSHSIMEKGLYVVGGAFITLNHQLVLPCCRLRSVHVLCQGERCNGSYGRWRSQLSHCCL